MKEGREGNGSGFRLHRLPRRVPVQIPMPTAGAKERLVGDARLLAVANQVTALTPKATLAGIASTSLANGVKISIEAMLPGCRFHSYWRLVLVDDIMVREERLGSTRSGSDQIASDLG